MGKYIKQKVEEAGVEGNWFEASDASTGACACVIVKNERSLCVDLGAAKKYST